MLVVNELPPEPKVGSDEGSPLFEEGVGLL